MAKSKTVASVRSLSKQDKKDHVAAYLAGSEEMSDYCNRTGLPYRTFWSWHKRYAEGLEAASTEEVVGEEDLPSVGLEESVGSIEAANGVNGSANGHHSNGSHAMSVYAAEISRLKAENQRLRKVLNGQQKIIGELV